MGIAAKPKRASILLLFLIDFCFDKLELVLRRKSAPTAVPVLAGEAEVGVAECAATATAQSS